MIEEEIAAILNEDGDKGRRLNDLADQFRAGRAPGGLLSLLNSDDSERISVGLWILGELPFERYCQDEFTQRLRELLGHPEASVRLTAFIALYPALEIDRILGHSILKFLRGDPNEGVRAAVAAAAERLSLTDGGDK